MSTKTEHKTETHTEFHATVEVRAGEKVVLVTRQDSTYRVTGRGTEYSSGEHRSSVVGVFSFEQATALSKALFDGFQGVAWNFASGHEDEALLVRDKPTYAVLLDGVRPYTDDLFWSLEEAEQWARDNGHVEDSFLGYLTADTTWRIVRRPTA